MSWQEIGKRILRVAVVIGITWLLIHPVIWITCGSWIFEGMGLLILAALISRIVFKRSIKELIFGRNTKDDM